MDEGKKSTLHEIPFGWRAVAIRGAYRSIAATTVETLEIILWMEV